MLSQDQRNYLRSSPSAASLQEASTSRTEKVLASPAEAVAAATDHSGLLSGFSDLGPLGTTVTLQRPVQLNKEDELVYTFVEELPGSSITDLSRSSRVQSLPSVTSGWQPVSIISSINNEYESFMSLPGYQEPGTSLIHARRPHPQDNFGPLKSEVPQAHQPSSPLTTSHHIMLQGERADPSRIEACVSTRKTSLGQWTLKRPAGDHSTTMSLNLQEPSSDLGSDQGHSLIKLSMTPGSFWKTQGPSGSTRSSKLRKKANLLRDLTLSKKSNLDHNSKTALPKRASTTSQDGAGTSVTEKDLQRQRSRGHTPTGHESSNSRSPLKAPSVKQQPFRPHSRNSMKETSVGQNSKFNVTSTNTSPDNESHDPPDGLGSVPIGDVKSNREGRTFPGPKVAISRRLLQLASVRRGKQCERSHQTGTGSAGDAATVTPPLHPPSPYSKVTAPRRRYSSDSSVLSSELLPSMGCTTPLHNKGGASSSGYGSSTATIDCESTASSVHRSPSEKGLTSSNQSRAFRLPRKRGNGEWPLRKNAISVLLMQPPLCSSL